MKPRNWLIILGTTVAVAVLTSYFHRAPSGARMVLYSIMPAALPERAGEIESAWRSPLDWAELQLAGTGMTGWVHDSFPTGESYRKVRDSALRLDQPGHLEIRRQTQDIFTITVFDSDPLVAGQLCEALFRYLQTVSQQQLDRASKDGGHWEEDVRSAESKVLTFEQQFQAELSQPRRTVTPFALSRYGLSLQSLAAQRQIGRRREAEFAAAAPQFIVLEAPTAFGMDQ